MSLCWCPCYSADTVVLLAAAAYLPRGDAKQARSSSSSKALKRSASAAASASGPFSALRRLELLAPDQERQAPVRAPTWDELYGGDKPAEQETKEAALPSPCPSPTW